MIRRVPKNKGLIKLILIIIIGIIILSYFGFNIQSIVESPESQSNLGYIWGLVVTAWTNYLMQPVTYFWNNIFIDLLWSAFVSNFDRIKNGEPTDFELSTPAVQYN